MIVPKILSIFGLMSLIAFCKNAISTNWHEIFKRDVHEIYTLIKENHPGVVDAHHSHQLNKWLDEGYNRTLELKHEIISFEHYKYALLTYVNGFRDGHLSLINIKNPNVNKRENYSLWPGFLVSYLDGKFFVSSHDEMLKFCKIPPIGSELVMCNDLSPKDFFLNNVIKFYGKPYDNQGNILHADWVRFAPLLFVRISNPFIQKIKTSTFLVDNELKEYPLHWMKINDTTLSDYLGKASYQSHHRFDLRKIDNDGIWITIPTFAPKTQSDSEKFTEIINQLGNYRNSEFIVFDVRGNGGGDSSWIDKILKSLYGQDFFESVVKKTIIPEVRLTLKNIDTFYQQVYSDLEATRGPDNPIIGEIRQEHNYFLKKLKEGNTFASAPKTVINKDVSKNIDNKNVKNPVSASIYILTDSFCSSSTLMFLDDFLQIPHVIQVGHPTNADTPFTEPVLTELPSTYAMLRCPRKIRRHFPRKANQPHIPKYFYHADISDTQEVGHWLVSLHRKLKKQ